MSCTTCKGLMLEVFALAREGMRQSVIAGCVGLTHTTVNRIQRRHAPTASLVLGKSTRAPRNEDWLVNHLS